MMLPYLAVRGGCRRTFQADLTTQTGQTYVRCMASAGWTVVPWPADRSTADVVDEYPMDVFRHHS